MEGIRVLDLSRVLAGPFATMVLGDLGAEVIKIEQPGRGDIARGNGPFIHGLSSYFLSLNRGKKSMTLDLAQQAGREIFIELAERGDVVVENFVPGTMKPRLVYAACSGFGQTGPYAGRPALDVIIQAMGGIMSITGEPDGPPVRPGVSLGDIAAGLFLCVGILAALRERTESGQGQMVDIGMLDCQVAILENAFARYFATGEIPRPLSTRHPVFTPFQVFRASDGYVAVAITGEQWPLFCATIERVDIIDEPGFADGYSRTQHYGELEPILSQAIEKNAVREWLTRFEAVGIPCGPVNRIDEVAGDPQVASREMIVQVAGAGGECLRVINTPLKLSRTPGLVDKPSPELGEHTEGVLAGMLNVSRERITELRRCGVI
ncbi:MAG: CaiB/BaiF CoA-transferase family protein [Chloroflexi bacterium]|nr:CaiB/BaiF CoA-transferase family protein [Chloroflexota bacterium]